MASNGWCYRLGKYFIYTYAMLSGSLPSDKMGYYMGVFNFFIVIPVSCRIHFRVLVSKFLIMNLFMHFYWWSINDSSVIALTINDETKLQ
jgi:maltose/moltooligosaccharide transporter